MSNKIHSASAPQGLIPSRDELALLFDELWGWHNCLDSGAIGDGAFRIYCENGETEQTRLNLRVTLREAAAVIRELISNQDEVCGCGHCSAEVAHTSDCAVHNAPAEVAGACSCPAGWILVPREPTDEMDAAARAECHRIKGVIDPVMHIWDVMLAAAPSAQVIEAPWGGDAKQLCRRRECGRRSRGAQYFISPPAGGIRWLRS